jgi:hypothetical protein
VVWAIIKQIQAKRLVCRAFQERMKIELVQQNVKIAPKDNIKVHRATKPVWVAKLGST